MNFNRREIIKLAAAFSAGVAASGAFALSPYIAPSPEKKHGEKEDPIDIMDAQNMVIHDGVKDTDVDDTAPTEVLDKADTKKALELMREIDSDNQQFVVAGGLVGSATSTALDGASNIEAIENYVPESGVTNVATSAISTAILGWATRKHHSKIAKTRSAEHLSDKYGMSAKKANNLANHEKTMSCASAFIGAALAATVNRGMKFVAGKLEERNKHEQTIDLD